MSTVISLATPVAHSSRVEVEPDQRVGAGLDAAAGSAPASAAPAGRAEEGVHDVAQAAEAGEGVAQPPPPPRAVVERVAAEVDDLALLRVGQHLVGRGDLAELVLASARSGLTSGCSSLASLRYARLIVLVVASCATPSVP